MKYGIRDFAIFFDDLSGEQSGSNQANFLNKLQNSLDKKYIYIDNIIIYIMYLIFQIIFKL